MNAIPADAGPPPADADAEYIGDATYDPADDKLRLKPYARLDKETYERVKALGFGWAPKQGCFFAVWAPAREDLLVELCGEIGDEDTSLVERASARSERFEGYEGKRAEDARRARDRSDAISERFAGGQPILVGHHSEKRARRDKQKMDDAMRRAVGFWKTSEYWGRRAEACLRHAKHLEAPGVRHRRIKKLEADVRRHEREKDKAQKFLTLWSKEGLTAKQAIAIANVDHLQVDVPGQTWGVSAYGMLERGELTADAAAALAIPRRKATIAHADRWLEHLGLRLAYERAMLGEQGGAFEERFELQPGGRVFDGRAWQPILRVNRSEGKVTSVSVPSGYSWADKLSVERIRDYRPPAAGDAKKIAAVTKLGPIVNYKPEGAKVIETTKAEFDKWRKYQAAWYCKVPASDKHAAHRRPERVIGGDYRVVFITDAPVVLPPPPAPADASASPAEVLAPEPGAPRPVRERAKPSAEAAEFQAMEGTLKAGGVQVVVADQLFPTPDELAARMVLMACVAPGVRVLEPSVGTGSLVRAIERAGAECFGVEVDPKLAALTGARCVDFLALEPGDGGAPYDRVVMNPPFKNGVDIEHILHAIRFLAPGGRLVALCANGPRQRAALKPRASQWIDLPEGTFAAQGTNVRVAIFVYDAPTEKETDHAE